MEKAKDQTSIVTVVSFDGSSSDGYKIAMQRTDGCMVTLTTLAVITKAGTTLIPAHALSAMCESNGLKTTVVKKENGNEL